MELPIYVEVTGEFPFLTGLYYAQEDRFSLKHITKSIYINYDDKC